MIEGFQKLIWGEEESKEEEKDNTRKNLPLPDTNDEEAGAHQNQDTSLPSSQHDSSADDPTQKLLRWKRNITLAISSFVIMVAIACVTLHSFALYQDQDTVVYVSSICGILMSLGAIHSQYILASIETLRCVHNKIRMQINTMMTENNKLQRNVGALQSQVERVQNVEDEIAQIAQGSDQNVKKLVEIVKENERIVKRQGELARQAFQEQLFTSILRTDRNQDMHITDREVDVLILRMKAQDGITLKDDKFREHIMKSNGSIWSIMELLNEISIPKEGQDWIIRVDESVLIHAKKSNCI